VEAKYYGGSSKKLRSAKDFDELLWQYQAISDTPCVLFTDELLEAYPDAKVILTERDVESWAVSMQCSFCAVFGQRIWWLLQVVDKVGLRLRGAVSATFCDMES